MTLKTSPNNGVLFIQPSDAVTSILIFTVVAMTTADVEQFSIDYLTKSQSNAMNPHIKIHTDIFINIYSL